eukprot:1775440-Pleurochrysis_carterae.AAC.1
MSVVGIYLYAKSCEGVATPARPCASDGSPREQARYPGGVTGQRPSFMRRKVVGVKPSPGCENIKTSTHLITLTCTTDLRPSSLISTHAT